MKKITGPALMVGVLLLAACGSDEPEAVDGVDDTTEAVEETVAETAPADTSIDETGNSVAESTAGAVEETAVDEGTAETTADETSDSAPADASEEAADLGAGSALSEADQQGAAGEGMIVVNQVAPVGEEQIAEIQQPGPDGPIYMVNLLEFKEFAEYEDGRETDLTGREAYALYAEGQRDVLPLFGAEVVFEGDVSFLAIGEVEELWDEVAIVRYPSRATLLEMSASPEFMAVSVHRTAGLAGQLNIETVEP
ncbi:MAG: DUF1330 domain-containing protein [Actinomycetota bacterium]